MAAKELVPEVKKPNGSELAMVSPHPFMLFQQAIAQGMTVEQLQVFQQMCERHDANEARKAYVAAMNAFKKHPPTIMKDATATIRSKKGEGSSFQYKYAPLDTVCRAIVAGLSEHGISHKWAIDDSNMEIIKVSCILTHDLGHSEETSMRSAVERSDFVSLIQSRAIVVSYLERYTLLAATGLAPTDDADGGNGADSLLDDVSERIEYIENCRNFEELKGVFKTHYTAAKEAKDNRAEKLIVAAYEAKKRELNANR